MQTHTLLQPQQPPQLPQLPQAQAQQQQQQQQQQPFTFPAINFVGPSSVIGFSQPSSTFNTQPTPPLLQHPLHKPTIL
jgi:hypothetical protein